MNAPELERLEAVIDAAGVAAQIEALLPVGVRPRQLSVRTLLLGMLLVAADCRPAHLRSVHQALLGLPEPSQHRLGIIAHWRDRPAPADLPPSRAHLRPRRPKLANDTARRRPVRDPHRDPRRAARSEHPVLGEPARAATPWTGPIRRRGHAPHPKQAAKRDDPKPLPADDEPHADPKQPTPDNSGDGDGEDDQRCADPEASWGHRRGNHPGQKDEAFYGYYLQAATTVKDEHGPEVPELVRRMQLTSCHIDPPPAFVPVLERMASDSITIADVLADSGYAYRIPENWALPIRALGADLIQDLHPNDRGPNGTHMGATCANGNLYCPATPTTLLGLHHSPRAAERRTDRRHDQQCAELAHIQALADHPPRPRRLPPRDLPRRPRQTPLPTQTRVDDAARTTAPRSSHPPQHPPACCQQKTITVPASVNAKTAQKHDYPSPAAPPLLQPPLRRRTHLRNDQRPRHQQPRQRLVPNHGPDRHRAVHRHRPHRPQPPHHRRPRRPPSRERTTRRPNGLPPKRRKRRRQTTNELIAAAHASALRRATSPSTTNDAPVSTPGDSRSPRSRHAHQRPSFAWPPAKPTTLAHPAHRSPR